MSNYLLITHPVNEDFLDKEYISLLKSFYGKKTKIDSNNVDLFFHEYLTDELIFIFKDGEDSGRIRIVGEELPPETH